MATSNIVSSLGAGSGIDIKELAKNLVEAEKTPRKEAIDAKIAKSEARISGLALVNYSLTEIKNALGNLNDASDFTSLTATNSQSSAFAITTDSAAQAGNFNVNVTQIATAQRSPSGAFAARSTVLNGGAPFDLSLKIGSGATQTINVTTATPAGVVSAINGANLGVTAQLLNTGDAANPFTIVVSGQTGTNNNFSITSAAVDKLNFGTSTASKNLSSETVTSLSARTTPLNLSINLGGVASQVTVAKPADRAITPADIAAAINSQNLGVTANLVTNTGNTSNPFTLVFSAAQGASTSFSLASTDEPGLDVGSTRLSNNNLQEARNANFTVDGLAVSRSSNTIKDVIPGVSLELFTATTGNARIDLKRDSSGIEEKLNTLVKAYNDFMDNMKILGDSASDVEMYGGALAGDSFLSSIKSQVRQLVMGDSSTPGTRLKAARDVGIDIDRNGKMSLNTTKLESALNNHFSDVVTLFSANTNNQSIYSPLPGGLAGDGLKKIDVMLRSDGTVARQTDTTNALIERQKAELKKLEGRMEKLLERYTRQFSAMDSIVSSINGQRSSLENSMKGLMAMYTKD